MFPDGLYYLQHDRAPAHASTSTSNCLEELAIPSIPWPAKSPDLNLIENIWALMKNSVEKRNPSSKNQLKECIQTAWNEIPLETITNLYASMRSRLERVIAVQGDTI